MCVTLCLARLFDKLKRTGKVRTLALTATLFHNHQIGAFGQDTSQVEHPNHHGRPPHHRLGMDFGGLGTSVLIRDARTMFWDKLRFVQRTYHMRFVKIRVPIYNPMHQWVAKGRNPIVSRKPHHGYGGPLCASELQ